MKRRAMADKTKRKKKQAALAEAAAGSFEAQRESIYRALRTQSPDGPHWRGPCSRALLQSSGDR